MRVLLLFALLSFLNLTSYAQGTVADPLKRPLPELPTANLASVGMNTDSVMKLIALIRTTPPNDFRGLVVIKDNRLVVEEYFHTYWRETVHDVRSAGKSVTALLLGIAIDKGLVKSTEQSIYDFFPKSKFGTPPNDAHRDIKIKHLLTMSSGLNAGQDDAPGNTENWLTSDNWVSFALTLPLIFKPGEKWVYNDVCPMLIGAIIEETSGMKLADFAKENLFTPLSIREYYWYTGVGGRTGPMGNLYLSALDFAKIGALVLNKGVWQNKKIVSSTWTDEMIKQRIDITGDNPFSQGYGYFWYMASKEVNHKKYEYYFASGNGGNLLIIIPSENMVVSLISSAYGPGLGHSRSFTIFNYILSAIEKR